jgi:hypothetical protein
MRIALFVFTMLLVTCLVTCSGSKPHRFAFEYSPPQALRICHQVLREQGYQMTIFDPITGILKTKPREFIGQEGQTVSYQIAIAVIRPHELRISVTPGSAIDYRDHIMSPLIEPLKAAGIHPKYIPPPPRRPRTMRRPPSPPPPFP